MRRQKMQRSDSCERRECAPEKEPTGSSPVRRRMTPRKWSQRVIETSDALDLKNGVFTLRSPKAIAASLKCSAQHSKRRKADPFRSALSMLTFYINRAG